MSKVQDIALALSWATARFYTNRKSVVLFTAADTGPNGESCVRPQEVNLTFEDVLVLAARVEKEINVNT